VLTRGAAGMPDDAEIEGVHVHRLREGQHPTDLEAFLTWVRGMNSDMIAAGFEPGCPCIVADVGGLREVVPNPDVGLRFTAREPRSLADAMERVLADDELRDGLVAEAAEHVMRFDWADIARQTTAVYRELSAAPIPT
jgi:glycosyltransferase involved in cell wall biosynthesis